MTTESYRSDINFNHFYLCPRLAFDVSCCVDNHLSGTLVATIWAFLNVSVLL